VNLGREYKRGLARDEWLAAAGVAAVTLLTYASTFTFGWVYDDVPQISQNPNLTWSQTGYLFAHHLWAGLAVGEARFYRPLLMLWFVANKTLFGLNPHWFHVTTVLAHVAATVLSFFVARELLKSPEAALVAAAIFGLHPLQAETASWISSVNDSLAAVLCFCSFLAYRRAARGERQRAIWWALAGMAFIPALLIKEVSVVLAGVVLIDIWAGSSDEPQLGGFGLRLRTAAGMYGGVAVVWFAFRSWILGSAQGSSSVPWSTVVLSAPKIVLFEFYRMVLPVGLSPHYDFRPVESVDAQFLIAFVALLGAIAPAIILAKRERILAVALSWLLLPLLPSLNLRWMNEDDFIHDRYSYISILGVALIFGAGYAWMRKKWPQAQLVRPLTAALALILAFASATQSQYWANDVSLFGRGVSIAPENEWAQLNYGAALSGRGKYADAAPHFVRSYELKPGWRAADFAGFSYQQSGDFVQAEHWFQTAVQQDTSQATAWFGLGQIALAQHQSGQAIEFLEKAIALHPEAEGYHYELGRALEQASRPDEAVEAYAKELQLHPYQNAARQAVARLQNTNLPASR